MILLFARTFLKNARHLSQMKTLLDNHLDQQRSILAEFTEGGKANVREQQSGSFHLQTMTMKPK